MVIRGQDVQVGTDPLSRRIWTTLRDSGEVQERTALWSAVLPSCLDWRLTSLQASPSQVRKASLVGDAFMGVRFHTSNTGLALHSRVCGESPPLRTADLTSLRRSTAYATSAFYCLERVLASLVATIMPERMSRPLTRWIQSIGSRRITDASSPLKTGRE